MNAKQPKPIPKNPQTAPPSGSASVVSAQWQGPLPPPAALEQFDRIIPNGAERIMVMCEKEQDARLSVERNYATAEVAVEVGGRVVGAILILACLGAAIWSIHIGADWKVTLGFLSVPVMGALAKLFERRPQK